MLAHPASGICVYSGAMSDRRDRHGRGIRGPLVSAQSPSGPRPFRLGRADFFNECVTAAIAQITGRCPDAFDGVIVGVEEVPHLNVAWTGDRVPLSAAVEASRGKKAQIVIFERPLEHRSTSRPDLRQLVHRTIVEQLSILTARPISELAADDFDLE